MPLCYVYILTTHKNTALYTGVTNNLKRRITEHKNDINKKSFTCKYNIHKLVYFEKYTSILKAIAREKQLKGGSRLKKLNLIKTKNPRFIDLSTYLDKHNKQ